MGSEGARERGSEGAREREKPISRLITLSPCLLLPLSPALPLLLRRLRQSGISLLRIDIQIAHCLLHNFNFDLPLAAKRDERRQGDESVIDFKKVAQRVAAVAPAKSVSPQRDQTSWASGE